MNFNIPYGKGEIKFKIPYIANIIKPNKVNINNENELILKALNNPIGKEPIDQFISKAKKILILVNDATKPTPTQTILKNIYPYIINKSNVKFLIANGTHRKPTVEELKFIFGKYYIDFKNEIHIHDAYKKENMDYLGISKKGTELYINKMVLESENVIVIGSIEPHYFAGYTGGRKSFFPGIAAYKTIEMNHSLALSDNASSLSLKNNPVHRDLTDSINFLKDVNIFSIQTVLTHEYNIYSVKCGDIKKSFNESISYANDVYLVPIKKKGNIVITVVPSPMDINLYQSQHALENGNLALENGGVLILVSKCHKGIGNDAFLDLLSRAKSHQEVLKLLDGKYKLGSHKSLRMLKIRSKANLFAVTDLDYKIIEKAKFKPFSDIQSAVNEAIRLIKSKNKKPRIIIMPFGNLTIPKIVNK